MTTTLAAERLRRLLFIVPYVSKHQGLTVAEVAHAVGCSKDQLLEELDLLTLVGRPPFQPDDFVDIYVEDDRVYVELDQRLSAPPRLTASEGVALAAAAAILTPQPGGTLASALHKLEAVLPAEARAEYETRIRSLSVSQAGQDVSSPLATAIVERNEVTFDYLGVASGTRERRRVQPLELLSHRGQWYLQAFCLTARAERLFRLDRMSGLSVTSTVFERGATAPVRPGAQREKEVQVRFSPRIARWQQERFSDAGPLNADGSLTVTVPGDSERWLTRWVLSFGGEATVLAPPWAIRAVAEAARASLQSR